MTLLNLKLLWILFGLQLEKLGYFYFQHLVNGQKRSMPNTSIGTGVLFSRFGTLKSPYVVGQPGPPANQSMSGASSAFVLAGKNQKNRFELYVWFTVKKPAKLFSLWKIVLT